MKFVPDIDHLYREYKVIALPRDTHLTPVFLEKLDGLLESAPAHELREDLLEIYHAYLIHEHPALPLHFEKLATHIHLLIDFLGSVDRVSKTEFPSEENQ